MTIYLGSRYEPSFVDFVSTVPNGDENPIVFYDFPDIGTLTYYLAGLSAPPLYRCARNR